MRTQGNERADDYCDEHLLEVRRDPGEADPDGRIKRADPEYASLLIVEEVLRSPEFIAHVGFDPHAVLLTPTRTRVIATALPDFGPFCCYLGKKARERVIRKARHPPIEFEMERRAHAAHVHAPAPTAKQAAHEHRAPEGDDAPWANT